jgi:hypothetical protein
VATIAIGMGYRMNDDGSLSESARKAFWRLDAEAQTQRLITHGPCTCDTAEHDFHFRVATTLIAAHQVAKRRQISSPNGD